MALWSGQRQGDLLRLPWSAYETPYIRLRQSKGGRRVATPAGAPLRTLLDATTRRGPLILTTHWAGPGRPMALARRGGKACERAGIDGLTFHDLRGTAVVRLAIAGASVPQIAAVTGHSLKDVEAILDAHYLGRDIQLAEAAVKLEARTKL
nr:tyrosine-type recombinase/integrase [Bradyrhizobium symbiodeficiens]